MISPGGRGSLVAARLAVVAFAVLSIGLLALGVLLGTAMLYLQMAAAGSLYFLLPGVACALISLGLHRRSRIALLLALAVPSLLALQQIASVAIGGLSHAGLALPLSTILVILLVTGWPVLWRRRST